MGYTDSFIVLLATIPRMLKDNGAKTSPPYDYVYNPFVTSTTNLNYSYEKTSR